MKTCRKADGYHIGSPDAPAEKAGLSPDIKAALHENTGRRRSYACQADQYAEDGILFGRYRKGQVTK